MKKKLELARFELTKPNEIQCHDKMNSMFRDIYGLNYSQIYKKLIDKLLAKKHMYEQFTQLIILINDMEKYLMTRIFVARKSNTAINISLPTITIPPYIDQIILYDPEALTTIINEIIDYINELNINSILRNTNQIRVKKMDNFTTEKTNPCEYTITISYPEEFNTIDEYIKEMHKLLNHEMLIVEYIMDIEKYHCEVINHINLVFDKCKIIVNDLII